MTGLAAPGALQPSAYGKAVAFTVDITRQASSGAIDRDAAIAIRAAIAARRAGHPPVWPAL